MKSKNIKHKTDLTEIIGYISIAVIVISLAFIGLKITGLATTDTAVVNVTITEFVSINFTVDFLDFGSGGVTPATIGATINSEGSVTNGSWTPTSANLVLENNGNVNATINLSSSANAASFIGGTSPSFKIRALDKSGETGACQSPLSAYTELGTSNVTICGPLQYGDSNDEVNISVQLYIPSDALGAKTVTLTASATQAS